MKRFIFLMIADIMILLASFLLTVKFYQGAALPAIEKYQSPFMVFVILFLIASFIFNKYEFRKDMKFLPMLITYAKALLITAGISGLAIFLFQLGHYSRFIILGTMLGIAVFEFLWLAFYQVFLKFYTRYQDSNLPLKMIKRFANIRITFIAYISAIILLMALPLNSASDLNNITILHFRGDYFLHAILFLPWAFFGFMIRKSLPVWLLWGLLFAAGTEGLQYFLPYRAFNVNDVMANVIGVLAGFVLLLVYLKIRK